MRTTTRKILTTLFNFHSLVCCRECYPSIRQLQSGQNEFLCASIHNSYCWHWWWYYLHYIIIIIIFAFFYKQLSCIPRTFSPFSASVSSRDISALSTMSNGSDVIGYTLQNKSKLHMLFKILYLTSHAHGQTVGRFTVYVDSRGCDFLQLPVNVATSHIKQKW